jgi:hypothetical protein
MEPKSHANQSLPSPEKYILLPIDVAVIPTVPVGVLPFNDDVDHVLVETSYISTLVEYWKNPLKPPANKTLLPAAAADMVPPGDTKFCGCPCICTSIINIHTGI